MAQVDTRSGTTTTVIILCGLPGAGKSTLARKIVALNRTASNADHHAVHVHHIEYDVIEELLCEEAHVGGGNGMTPFQLSGFRQDGNHPKINDAEEDPSAFSRDIWKRSRRKCLALLTHYLEQASPPEQKGDKIVDKTLHQVILMDDNFHLRSMRREIYRICQDRVARNLGKQVPTCSDHYDGTASTTKYRSAIFFGLIWMDISNETCLQRNQLRSRTVPDDVLLRMNKTFEPPGSEDWEQGYLRIQETPIRPPDETINNDNLLSISTLENATRFVFSVSSPSWRQNPDDDVFIRMPIQVPPPPPPKDVEVLEREREKTRESWLHSWDQHFRSWVGHVARISRRDTPRANQARKTLLQQLRQNQNQYNHDHRGAGDPFPFNEQIRDWFLTEIGAFESWTGEQLGQFRMATIQHDIS